MTRDEFIDGYIKRSQFGKEATRTRLGFSTPDGNYLALPCQCDYEGCEGWSMLPDVLTLVALHCELHIPEGLPEQIFQVLCGRCNHQWKMSFLPLNNFEWIACPQCSNRNPGSFSVQDYEDKHDA